VNAQSAIVSRNASFGSVFDSFPLDGRGVLRDADRRRQSTPNLLRFRSGRNPM
jgi:hypothetical protein